MLRVDYRSMEQRRRGFVLGAGGVLGAAWTIGALSALEELEGFDAGRCDVIVGTSAGSVLAALLGAGVGSATCWTTSSAEPGRPGPLAGYTYDHDRATGGALPTMPGRGWARPRLLMRAVRHPRSVSPLAAASSLLPARRGAPVDGPAPGRRDEPDRRVVAAPGGLDRRDGLRHRPAGRLRPACGRARGRARRGGARLLLDPGAGTPRRRSAVAATSTAAPARRRRWTCSPGWAWTRSSCSRRCARSTTTPQRRWAPGWSGRSGAR